MHQEPSLQVSRQRRIDALAYAYDAQSKRFVSHCNLCSSDELEAVTERDRYGYCATAVGCLRCGLVFLNPVMIDAAYSDFYGDVYRPLVSAYHGRQIDAVTIQAEQKEYAAERELFLRDFVVEAKPKTLLDIGGSTGVVASYFAERLGLDASVLDPSPTELEHAKARGLETIPGLLESFVPGSRSFDLVLLCQTVDHLLDVTGALLKVREVMSPNGLFFIDAVDFQAVYRNQGSVEAAVKIDHPFSLTRETMTAYLLRTGFEILRVAYAKDQLHVMFVCRRAEPRPDYLPESARVRDVWQEMRAR